MAAPKAGRARASLERAGGAAIGTRLAVIDLASKVQPERAQWGGARNRRDRVTVALSLAQVRNLWAAVHYAERADLRLNRLVTVHWGAMGLSDADAGAALGRLLKLLRDALAALGLPFACVWARENDNGDGSKGSHVHILAHMPAAAGPGFLRRMRAWVRLAVGGRYNRQRGRVEGPAYVKGAVSTRRIGGRVAVPQELHDANLAAALGYLAKGADDATAAALGLRMRAPGGRVIGKRCGWSENIGARARQRAYASAMCRVK